MIGITLGIIVGIAAIAGLGIGLYTVIQNSKTATATTSEHISFSILLYNSE